jgi:hypothetical protein
MKDMEIINLKRCPGKYSTYFPNMHQKGSFHTQLSFELAQDMKFTAKGNKRQGVYYECILNVEVVFKYSFQDTEKH